MTIILISYKRDCKIDVNWYWIKIDIDFSLINYLKKYFIISILRYQPFNNSIYLFAFNSAINKNRYIEQKILKNYMIFLNLLNWTPIIYLKMSKNLSCFII